MKLKSFLVGAFLVLGMGSARAQWFPAQAYVTVNPLQISAQVYNPYYEPIICNGQVFGQTSYGVVYNAYFAQQLIPAGHNRYAYAYTNAFAPFVNGWVNINCRYARYW